MSGSPWRRDRRPQGRAGTDSLLLTPADLGVGEACRIAPVLLRGDPGEDAVEMLVLDDHAGIEPGMIHRVEAGRELLAVGANGDRAVVSLADDRRRARRQVATVSSST